MEDVVKMVDHAAGQGDRWLMLGVLVVLFLFVGVALRYMVSFLEKLQAQSATDRELHRQSIEGIVDKYHELTTSIKVEMQGHTSAIRENTAVLQRLLEQRR